MIASGGKILIASIMADPFLNNKLLREPRRWGDNYALISPKWEMSPTGVRTRGNIKGNSTRKQRNNKKKERQRRNTNKKCR